MSKTYTLVFGTGDPRPYSGMSPTFLIFANAASGATMAAPAISEVLSATCGIYKFTWGTTTPISFLADAATTSPGAQGRYVYGQIDPADRADEYGTSIVAFGSTLIGFGTSTVAFGSTLVGYGSTLIGFGTSTVAFGSTLTGYGVTLLAGQVNIGTTLVGIGNTLSSIGVSLSVGFIGIGSTASSFGDNTTDPGTLFGYLKRIQENLEGNSNFVKLTGAWSIYNRGSSTLLAAKTVANSSSQVIKT